MNIETFKQGIQEIINQTDTIKREEWTDNQLITKFARRTINEILQEKTTHYANSCVDQAPVEAYLLNKFLEQHLQEQNYTPLFYIEIAKSYLWNPEGTIVMHFATGVDLHSGITFEKGIYHINNHTHNEVLVTKGPLQPDKRKEVTRIQLITKKGAIDPTKSLLDNFPHERDSLGIKDPTFYAQLLIKEKNKLNEFAKYEQRCQTPHFNSTFTF